MFIINIIKINRKLIRFRLFMAKFYFYFIFLLNWKSYIFIKENFIKWRSRKVNLQNKKIRLILRISSPMFLFYIGV